MVETKEDIEDAAQGVQRGDKIVVCSQNDVEYLSQSGYGIRLEKTKLALTIPEALYLVAERRLKVIAGKEVEFSELFRKSRSQDPEIWAKYVLYRDLRSRGYVVREDSIGEIGFRVYERGAYPKKAAKYVVFPLREGSPISLDRLSDVLHSAEATKKRLIIAVVDRHGEIVYYSLTQFNPY